MNSRGRVYGVHHRPHPRPRSGINSAAVSDGLNCFGFRWNADTEAFLHSVRFSAPENSGSGTARGGGGWGAINSIRFVLKLSTSPVYGGPTVNSKMKIMKFYRLQLFAKFYVLFSIQHVVFEPI